METYNARVVESRLQNRLNPILSIQISGTSITDSPNDHNLGIQNWFMGSSCLKSDQVNEASSIDPASPNPHDFLICRAEDPFGRSIVPILVARPFGKAT
jgi:hypothetical protein